MSVSPVAYITKLNLGVSCGTPSRAMIFADFSRFLKGCNPTGFEPEITSLGTNEGATEDFAQVGFTYKLRESPPSCSEAIVLRAMNNPNNLTFGVYPSSTLTGYDSNYVGDEEAGIKTEALTATINSLFRAADGDIAITTVDTAEPPHDIKDSLGFLPDSKYSLVSKRLASGMEDYLCYLNRNGSVALDWGSCMELIAGPYPFGLTIFPRDKYEDRVNPYEDYRERLGIVLEEVVLSS